MGMVIFGWYLVNPHVQAVQNMCVAEGVLGRVTEGQSSPSFQKKLPTFRCHKKIVGDQFFVTPQIFANGTHFVTLDRLQATKTGSKLCCTPLS